MSLFVRNLFGGSYAAGVEYMKQVEERYQPVKEESLERKEPLRIMGSPMKNRLKKSLNEEVKKKEEEFTTTQLSTGKKIQKLALQLLVTPLVCMDVFISKLVTTPFVELRNVFTLKRLSGRAIQSITYENPQKINAKSYSIALEIFNTKDSQYLQKYYGTSGFFYKGEEQPSKNDVEEKESSEYFKERVDGHITKHYYSKLEKQAQIETNIEQFSEYFTKLLKEKSFDLFMSPTGLIKKVTEEYSKYISHKTYNELCKKEESLQSTVGKFQNEISKEINSLKKDFKVIIKNRKTLNVSGVNKTKNLFQKILSKVQSKIHRLKEQQYMQRQKIENEQKKQRVLEFEALYYGARDLLCAEATVLTNDKLEHNIPTLKKIIKKGLKDKITKIKKKQIKEIKNLMLKAFKTATTGGTTDNGIAKSAIDTNTLNSKRNITNTFNKLWKKSVLIDDAFKDISEFYKLMESRKEANKIVKEIKKEVRTFMDNKEEGFKIYNNNL